MQPASACKRGDVIQVQGSAASGKSHLLYYMLMNCILPPSIGPTKLQGWGKLAVLLDTDHKFDVQRFSQLLRSRVKRFLPLNSSDVEVAITMALDLLHVFQPTSSHQLIATIQHLPMYLATNLPDVELGILAVDSITAFYWSDRFILEQARLVNRDSAPVRPKNPLNPVSVALQSFARSHGPLILLSVWDLNLPSKAQVQRHLDPLAKYADTSMEILPASCHITLAASSAITGTKDVSFTNTTHLSGIVRTPGSSQITEFSLCTTEDDLFVP